MTQANPSAPCPASGPAPSVRLRSGSGAPRFHIVLVEPEIPPNTGNVGRLCAATGARLHLVEPLGFRIDEQAVRRAGLDYWPLVDLQTHRNFTAATQAIEQLSPNTRFWFFTGKAERSYLQAPFAAGDALVFGKESTGLSTEIVEQHAAQCVGIPTLGAVRSLNLANCVAIGLYEALRQVGELDQAQLGPGKR